jgi:hypothetical protein
VLLLLAQMIDTAAVPTDNCGQHCRAMLGNKCRAMLGTAGGGAAAATAVISAATAHTHRRCAAIVTLCLQHKRTVHAHTDGSCQAVRAVQQRPHVKCQACSKVLRQLLLTAEVGGLQLRAVVLLLPRQLLLLLLPLWYIATMCVVISFVFASVTKMLSSS